MLKTPDTTGGALRESWRLVLDQNPAGVLQLWATPAGYRWKWLRKPEHLVDLLGVDASVGSDLPQKSAWRFPDTESAIAHLMHCTGVAFPWNCGLAAD